MSCPRAQWLHGYFDGELDAARAAEFEAHLGSCSACVAALATENALRDAIVGARLYAKASPSLQTRVRAALPALPAAAPRRGRLLWRGLGAAAAAAIVLVGLWRFAPGVGDGAAERLTATEVLDAHLRSLQPAHLIDVASSDQHAVRPWFNGKLDFAPPVADLASDGFPLTGGRLDVVGGRSVAALVYGRRKHVINLFVWPAGEADASHPASGSARGYQWVHWTHGGMHLWAVSDVTAADVEEFARLLRR